MERIGGEDEGGVAIGEVELGLEGDSQGLDAAREVRVENAVARGGVDESGSGGWRRRGLKLGENEVSDRKRRRFGREWGFGSEAVESVGLGAKAAVWINTIRTSVMSHFSCFDELSRFQFQLRMQNWKCRYGIKLRL